MSLLKFDVGCVLGPVGKITLSLFVTNESRQGGLIYMTNNGWSGKSVTWNTSPAATGDVIKSIGKVKSNKVVKVELPKDILNETNSSLISFIIKPIDKNGAYYDKGGGEIPGPKLYVTYSGNISNEGCDALKVKSATVYSDRLPRIERIDESSGD